MTTPSTDGPGALDAGASISSPGAQAHPDPTAPDHKQVRRLQRFLDWMTPIVFLFAPVDTTIGVVFDSRGSLMLGLLLFVLGGLLLWARTALRRGQLEHAVMITAASISGCTPVFVFLRPHLFPVLAMGSLLAVSVALPFLRGARLKRLIVGAWLASVVVIVLGDRLVTVAPSDVPAVIIRWSVGTSLAILLGLVLLMMGAFSERLNETLRRMHVAQAEVEASNVQLQRLHRVKTEFMNQAAHELNTPLTPIRLQMHLLKSGDLDGSPQRQRHAIDIVDRNVERLAALVRDLLDATRLEAGRLVVQKAPVEAHVLLQDTFETFAEPARQAEITLEVEPGPDLVLHADAQRITQVLYNLVVNAIKFTPPQGRVKISLAEHEGWARFTVADTGIGLAAEDRPRLFQPFSQVGLPASGAPSGTGLGLYISRGILEAHGGRIWAESDGPGRGSAFIFELPPARAVERRSGTPPVLAAMPRVM